MTDDSQVAQLFRSATSDLEPPIAVVARATSRGRSLRRRNVAGTTLVSLAFVGLAAVAVPQLLPAGTDGPPSGGPVAQPSVTVVPDPVPGDRVPVAASDGATVLAALLSEFGAVTETANDDEVRVDGVRVGRVESAETGSLASRAVLNGGTVEVTLQPLHSQADIDKAKERGDTLSTAREECRSGQDDACTRLPDGSYFAVVTSREKEPGMEAVRQIKATLWTTDGFVLRLFAFNARPVSETELQVVPDRKPVLGGDQLRQVATSHQWWRAAP
jgi:hypothetical protein